MFMADGKGGCIDLLAMSRGRQYIRFVDRQVYILEGKNLVVHLPTVHEDTTA